ncbi:MAG: DUF362 domain-containing protein [Candidatus Latescibacterota bacterium]
MAAALLAGPVAAAHPVAVVPSDDAALPHPAGRHQQLSADQVAEMVRRAVDLVGGMSAFVPDTARTVLLKPNIGTFSAARSGVNTDDRVVRAVALLVHQAAPRARILIAEGPGGWVGPAQQDCTGVDLGGARVVDGFELSGHRRTVAELRGRGIDIECFDLNFDRAVSLRPANGGLATDEYSVAASVLEADAWINIPVAKTHGAKITCAMKNHFGLLPGRVYGWSKSRGTRGHPGMPHSPRQMDEAWIDLYGLTRVDLNVVDMIAGSQAGAFEEDNVVRSNLVLAGANPVATDLVAARLMGFNPDDMEFAELAWQQGLGPRRLEGVEVRGAGLDPLVRRWKKAGVQYGTWGEWGEHANYGMGPRYWALLGPLPRDHAFTPAQLAGLAPTPGKDGWSEVVYFGHDRIDLDKRFDDPADCAVYAFTRFTMARSDSVRWWVGSDDDLDIWLDGLPIYQHRGRRRHVMGMDRRPAFVPAGEHRLLVRAAQERGDYDFSFNICEPIDDPLFAGNRYPGVRYFVEAGAGSPVAVQRVAAEDAGGDRPSTGREVTVRTLAGEDPLERSRTAPDTVVVEGVPAPRSTDLLVLLAQLAGVARPDLDETTLAVLGRAPFTMGHTAFGREGFFPAYGPEVTRVLDWLGLRYAVSYGYGRRESLRTIQGWLAQGRVPVTGSLERGRGGRRWGGPRRSEWVAITGYRQAGQGVELRVARPDGVAWVVASADWTGILPGGSRESCPLLVVEAGGEGVTGPALVDSVAALALELGLRSALELPAREWGTRTVPGGLAGWDAWVTDWERLPLIEEWASQPEVLERLVRLGTRYPVEVAEGRLLASRFFARAAREAGDPERRAQLAQAAAGYGQAAQAMQQLCQAMPQGGRGTRLSEEDRQRLARLGEARSLVRQARDGERRALQAVARLLGRPALPEVHEDPLRRREQGVRLFTWRAGADDAVYDLRLTGQALQVEVLHGDEEGSRGAPTTWQVHAAMPQRPGWTVAVEPLRGSGLYQVVEQPERSNGWQVVVRADDTDSWQDDTPAELAVWAVPAQRLSGKPSVGPSARDLQPRDARRAIRTDSQ